MSLGCADFTRSSGADVGVYLKHYLKLDLNWRTFDERTMDFCQGITLHHLPGHTDGLIGMQINLPNSGTYLFISDHCHVIENVSAIHTHAQVISDSSHSGVMAFHKAGLLGTTQHGSGLLKD